MTLYRSDLLNVRIGYFSSVGYVFLTFIYSEDGVRGHPRLPDADKGGGNESQQMQEWQKSLNRHISRKFSSSSFLAPTEALVLV